MIWLWVATAVVLDGIAGLGGAIVPERWLARHRVLMLGFATGTLLASGLGEVLPEAVARRGGWVLCWAATAVVVLAVVERLAARREHHRQSVTPVMKAPPMMALEPRTLELVRSHHRYLVERNHPGLATGLLFPSEADTRPIGNDQLNDV
jgi:hypothetical protein